MDDGLPTAADLVCVPGVAQLVPRLPPEHAAHMLQLLSSQLDAQKQGPGTASSMLPLVRCMRSLAAQPALRQRGHLHRPLLDDLTMACWVQVALAPSARS